MKNSNSQSDVSLVGDDLKLATDASKNVDVASLLIEAEQYEKTAELMAADAQKLRDQAYYIDGTVAKLREIAECYRKKAE